jgi:hypothetical protein
LRQAGSLVDEGGVFDVTWQTFRNNGRLNAEALRALILAIVDDDENALTLDSRSQIQIFGFDENGRKDSYSLRRDYVSVKQTMRRDANGDVTADEAYAALERAYNQALPRFLEQAFLTRR